MTGRQVDVDAAQLRALIESLARDVARGAPAAVAALLAELRSLEPLPPGVLARVRVLPD